MSRHLVLCYTFILPMIYKIELYLGRIASLAIFLWAYWQQIYLKCWYRATVFPDKRLKNRAALAVTTEIQPHQELPVWGCWLDVLWQKIFDICYCRYSDFWEPGCCFNNQRYPGSWGMWILCICCLGCSAALSLDLGFLKSLCGFIPAFPLVVSLSV